MGAFSLQFLTNRYGSFGRTVNQSGHVNNFNVHIIARDDFMKIKKKK